VIVAAGHTAADPDTLTEARRCGLTGYTHLYNAMPPLMGRAPGPVGAAMVDSDAFCSIIADMHHVSALALRLAIAARGSERTILVTDAMSPTGSDISSFELNGRTILRGGGHLTTADGTLAGADLDMATAVRNCVNALGLERPVALRMASEGPARFLKLDRELGRIAPGLRADLVLLDGGLEVRRTWIGGQGA
jgi:N-acetylglucosamine-6-phosphate deacetylase